MKSANDATGKKLLKITCPIRPEDRVLFQFILGFGHPSANLSILKFYDRYGH
jgi:hypothetical protein